MKRVNSESNTKQCLSIAESCASSTTVNTRNDNEAMRQKAIEAYDKTVEKLAEDIRRECETRRGGKGYYCYCVKHYYREDLSLQIIKCWEPRWDENDNPLPSVPNGKFTARIFEGDSFNEIDCETLQDAAYCLRLFLRIR